MLASAVEGLHVDRTAEDDDEQAGLAVGGAWRMASPAGKWQ